MARSSSNSNAQRRSRKASRGHRAGPVIVLALGMGGAGLVLPLDGGDPAEPISMLIVTEDATEGCPGNGVLLTFGADDNQDGTLEAAETDGSTTICDGARGTNGAPGTSGATCA